MFVFQFLHWSISFIRTECLLVLFISTSLARNGNLGKKKNMLNESQMDAKNDKMFSSYLASAYCPKKSFSQMVLSLLFWHAVFVDPILTLLDSVLRTNGAEVSLPGDCCLPSAFCSSLHRPTSGQQAVVGHSSVSPVLSSLTLSTSLHCCVGFLHILKAGAFMVQC